MNKNLLILFICLFFTLNLSADNETIDSDQLFKSGRNLFSEGKHTEAIKYFTKVISINPDKIEAYSYRGACYAQTKEYSNAIIDYSEILKIDPNNYVAYLNRGSVYLVTKDYNLSKEDFLKASTIKPDDSKPHQYLITIYSRLNDFKNMYYQIEQAVAKGSTNFVFIMQLVSNEVINSYEYYRFILSLKIKYIYKTKIDDSIPFHTLLLALKDSSFTMDSPHKSRIFQEERNKLGDKFEVEVWKFLGSDIDRHYYVSNFLDDSYFLHGNKPLFTLSTKIRDKGIELCEKQPEVSPEIVSLAVSGTLACIKNNQKELAKHYKNIAGKYLKLGDIYKSSFPALEDAERNLFDSLK